MALSQFIKIPTKTTKLSMREYVDSKVNEVGGDSFKSISGNLEEYPAVLTYDGETLDYITYDLGGGLEIVKTFNYTGDKLTSIVLSGDVPAGINLTKTFAYTGDQLTSITYS